MYACSISLVGKQHVLPVVPLDTYARGSPLRRIHDCSFILRGSTGATLDDGQSENELST